MNCFSKKSDMEIEFQRLGKHMRNFWPVRLSLFKYSVLGIKMDTLQFSVDLLYNFLDLGWGILRGQQKFRRRDISFQNLTYGLWLRINQNNMKPGLNLAADILRKSYFFFFLFLATRRSLQHFHLLFNYGGFLIVHYVCDFEAIEHNCERRKSCFGILGRKWMWFNFIIMSKTK